MKSIRILVLATSGVVACASAMVLQPLAVADASPSPVVSNPIKSTPESIVRGKQLFETMCMACHGKEGHPAGAMAVAGKPPANLSDSTWDHGGSDAQIFGSIKNGIGPAYAMIPWEGTLSDDDIWNVVNYIRTFKPAK